MIDRDTCRNCGEKAERIEVDIEVDHMIILDERHAAANIVAQVSPIWQEYFTAADITSATAPLVKALVERGVPGLDRAFIAQLPDGRYVAISLGTVKFCFLGESVEVVMDKAQRAYGLLAGGPRDEIPA